MTRRPTVLKRVKTGKIELVARPVVASSLTTTWTDPIEFMMVGCVRRGEAKDDGSADTT
jgi:hypothetical protein